MAKRCKAKFEFQVVTEVLTGAKRAGHVAKVHEVHLNTVNAWKRRGMETRAEVSTQDSIEAKYEQRVAEIKRWQRRAAQACARARTHPRCP